jgi:hypothetical protein
MNENVYEKFGSLEEIGVETKFGQTQHVRSSFSSKFRKKSQVLRFGRDLVAV